MTNESVPTTVSKKKTTKKTSTNKELELKLDSLIKKIDIMDKKTTFLVETLAHFEAMIASVVSIYQGRYPIPCTTSPVPEEKPLVVPDMNITHEKDTETRIRYQEEMEVVSQGEVDVLETNLLDPQELANNHMPTSSFTKDQVTAALQKVNEKFGMGRVKALLTEFEAIRISDIQEKDYEAFIHKCDSCR